MVHFSVFQWFAFALLIVSTILIVIPSANCGDFGSIKCNKGNWAPDGKLIGFGLSCPLPLDGKESTKGKTMQCAMKKAKVYDGKSVKKDKIGSEMCGVFPQEDMKKKCTEAIANCLKNSDDYFKDPKTDKEYKSWYPLFGCVEKWAKDACKK